MSRVEKPIKSLEQTVCLPQCGQQSNKMKSLQYCPERGVAALGWVKVTKSRDRRGAGLGVPETGSSFPKPLCSRKWKEMGSCMAVEENRRESGRGGKRKLS